MGLILNLETATKICSVSLAKDGKEIKTLTHKSDKYSHAEKLNGLIMSLFEGTNLGLKDLDAVAVSEGPGSYTGLRIGTSSAKGFCYAMDIPLIAVNSLKALAASQAGKGYFICPMFDARRMEVYSAIYDSEMNELEATRAVVVDEASYAGHLRESKTIFLGPGAEKCQDLIQSDNAIFELDQEVTAAGMISLSEKKFNDQDFVDLAYFEPFYLKDFIAGPPKKLL